MPINAVIGSQWGDEGKAKVIDYLSGETDIIVRYQGGPNAGHTVVVDDQKYVFHLIPSGILYPETICVLGNGVVVNLDTFFDELKELDSHNIDYKSRLFLSDSCHLILPFHLTIDAAKEKKLKDNKIGTTKRGIGVCYADKMMRIGLRLGDILSKEKLAAKLKILLDIKNQELTSFYDEEPVEFEPLYQKLLEQAEIVRPMVTNTSYFLNQQLAAGKNILLEGAQGMGLDVDFGTFPFVTSSNPTIGGALTGSGLSFHHLKDVYAIAKAYVTRVGEGPFPTELHGDSGEALRKAGNEFGATTGRPRRCGWFDLPLILHGLRVNGYTGIALTKIDILSSMDSIKICTGYKLNGKDLEYFPNQGLEDVEPQYIEMPTWSEDISKVKDYNDLPANCKSFITKIEELTGLPVKLVSLGPGRKDTIFRD